MRGTAFMKDWEKRALAERDAVVITEGCLLCREKGREWSAKGALRDVREAHAKHRALKHPDFVPQSRRKRHRLHHQMLGKTLDENIKEARKTGAAGWAGPE